jgi:hypothetical protein
MEIPHLPHLLQLRRHVYNRTFLRRREQSAAKVKDLLAEVKIAPLGDRAGGIQFKI